MPHDKKELTDNGRVWENMPVKAAQGFLWGPGYGQQHPSRIAVKNWLQKHYTGAKVKPTLLDIPSGSGVDFGLLVELVEYTGSDRTASVLGALRENIPGVRAFESDIREIKQEDKTYDIVLARAIFEHLPNIKDVEMAMKECVRVAKTHCIFSFFIPLSEKDELIDWNGQYFNNQYTKKDIEGILKKLGLKWEHEFVDVSGTEHADSYDIYYATIQ